MHFANKKVITIQHVHKRKKMKKIISIWKEMRTGAKMVKIMKV